MLRHEDNETLTRVQAGSAMGQLMRQYWIPVVQSGELDAGGRPKRVRLFGESLLAVRTGDGAPALVAEFCPHRRASLYFGRNETANVRCVYHGWAFDRAGRCIDMPNEPLESDFKHKVRHTAYPCRDWGGVVFAYMGPDTSEPPPLPEFEWALIGQERCFISKRVQHCNYLQALENGVADSSHVSFLHAPLASAISKEDRSHLGMHDVTAIRDTSPRFEVHLTAYGLVIGARRAASAAEHYWRVTQFIMPFWNMPPVDAGSDPIFHSHAWVPIDDEHCVNWSFSWHPSRALTTTEIADLRDGMGIHICRYAPSTSAWYGDVRPLATRENDYEMDWALHRTEKFCGIPGFAAQDQAMQESQGPIFDRTREHLGAADAGIIQLRKCLLEAARTFERTRTAPPSRDGRLYRVRPASGRLARDAVWIEALRERLVARI